MPNGDPQDKGVSDRNSSDSDLSVGGEPSINSPLKKQSTNDQPGDDSSDNSSIYELSGDDMPNDDNRPVTSSLDDMFNFSNNSGGTTIFPHGYDYPANVTNTIIIRHSDGRMEARAEFNSGMVKCEYCFTAFPNGQQKEKHIIDNTRKCKTSG